MKMNSLFNVCILGLDQSETITIQQHLFNILEGSKVDWVSANHGSLDFLIVNSKFSNSTSIQKMLNSKKFPILFAGYAVQEDIDNANQIQLPLVRKVLLKNWIDNNVLSKSIESVPQPLQRSKQIVSQVLTDNASVFAHLRTAQDGFLYLSDRFGAIGTIDVINQAIYLTPERDAPVDMQMRLKYEYLPSFSITYSAVDLLQWLWSVAWREPSCSELVQPNQLVNIIFWPQPSCINDQKDLLLMSARLAHDVSSAQDLATDLKIPVLRAQHFISALVMAGFAEIYSDSTRKVSRLPKKAVQQEEVTGLKRLLFGVRRRLGL